MYSTSHWTDYLNGLNFFGFTTCLQELQHCNQFTMSTSMISAIAQAVVLHDICSPTPVAGYFIIGPLLLTGLAATGLYWMEYTLDVEYLTTPINGRAKTERAVQDGHFPQNFSDFDPLRISSNGKYAQLIIEVMQNKVFFCKTCN